MQELGKQKRVTDMHSCPVIPHHRYSYLIRSNSFTPKNNVLQETWEVATQFRGQTGCAPVIQQLEFKGLT